MCRSREAAHDEDAFQTRQTDPLTAAHSPHQKTMGLNRLLPLLFLSDTMRGQTVTFSVIFIPKSMWFWLQLLPKKSITRAGPVIKWTKPTLSPHPEYTCEHWIVWTWCDRMDCQTQSQLHTTISITAACDFSEWNNKVHKSTCKSYGNTQSVFWSREWAQCVTYFRMFAILKN